jgi:hypothetical protein
MISKNTFFENGAVCGGAICFQSNSLGEIIQNTMDANKAGQGAGIFCTDFSDPAILLNIIVNSEGGLPIDVSNFSRPWVECCDLFGNTAGNDIPQDAIDGGGSFSKDPLFCGGPGTGNHYLSSSSPCLPENPPLGCGAVVGARDAGCTAVVGIKDETTRFRPQVRIYPNPFNATTSIRVEDPARAGAFGAAIYDVSGRRIRLLETGSREGSGGILVWDGRDDRGEVVPSGVYFCRVSTAGYHTVRKLVLLK